jgi:hypothetical protein
MDRPHGRPVVQEGQGIEFHRDRIADLDDAGLRAAHIGFRGQPGIGIRGQIVHSPSLRRNKILASIMLSVMKV